MKSTSFILPRRLLLGAALLLAAVSPAHAWWNDDWSLRRELTVDATALAATAPAGAETLARACRAGRVRRAYWSAADRPSGCDGLSMVAG